VSKGSLNRSNTRAYKDNYERLFGHSGSKIDGGRETVIIGSSHNSTKTGRPMRREHRSMAIHPSQVAEHNKLFPNIELKKNKGGFYMPITTSLQEAHKYAKARGFEDMN